MLKSISCWLLLGTFACACQPEKNGNRCQSALEEKVSSQETVSESPKEKSATLSLELNEANDAKENCLLESEKTAGLTPLEVEKGEEETLSSLLEIDPALAEELGLFELEQID